jgi:hypothetical protein
MVIHSDVGPQSMGRGGSLLLSREQLQQCPPEQRIIEPGRISK